MLSQNLENTNNVIKITDTYDINQIEKTNYRKLCIEQVINIIKEKLILFKKNTSLKFKEYDKRLERNNRCEDKLNVLMLFQKSNINNDLINLHTRTKTIKSTSNIVINCPWNNILKTYIIDKKELNFNIGYKYMKYAVDMMRKLIYREKSMKKIDKIFLLFYPNDVIDFDIFRIFIDDFFLNEKFNLKNNYDIYLKYNFDICFKYIDKNIESIQTQKLYALDEFECQKLLSEQKRKKRYYIKTLKHENKKILRYEKCEYKKSLNKEKKQIEIKKNIYKEKENEKDEIIEFRKLNKIRVIDNLEKITIIDELENDDELERVVDKEKNISISIQTTDTNIESRI